MNIVILNTGCANLASVKWAIKRLGYNAQISYDTHLIMQADKLIIPGVGTASIAMKYLNKYNLVNLIKNFNKPILGICLGMQLLGINSTENEGIQTLGIINASVCLIKTNYLPLPHIGWNKICFKSTNNLFHKINKNDYFYFVHSYGMLINNSTIAYCNYGQKFTAALQKNNFYGVQFHPEKSGKAGSQLLKNFLEIE